MAVRTPEVSSLPPAAVLRTETEADEEAEAGEAAECREEPLESMFRRVRGASENSNKFPTEFRINYAIFLKNS